jgi:hypothetical protein
MIGLLDRLSLSAFLLFMFELIEELPLEQFARRDAAQ